MRSRIVFLKLKCNAHRLARVPQLLELGVLKKSPGGGRSTGYQLADQ
ncbi:MAG: hypothetical protein PHY45_01200 [Rhodocyclaceae bacterium]|nr:hypothetical protein [Rhodocyclaceae bacterium]